MLAHSAQEYPDKFSEIKLFGEIFEGEMLIRSLTKKLSNTYFVKSRIMITRSQSLEVKLFSNSKRMSKDGDDIV